jgi:hypothetical protein
MVGGEHAVPAGWRIAPSLSEGREIGAYGLLPAARRRDDSMGPSSRGASPISA